MLKKSIPFLLVIFGLLLLFVLQQAEVAGIFILIGIVMLIERKWPEEWGSL